MMYRKLMVAYDEDEGASKALRAGLEIARELKLPLYLLTVEDKPLRHLPEPGFSEALKEPISEFCRGLVRNAVRAALADGVELYPAPVPGHDSRGVVEYAEGNGIDLIIVGSHAHKALAERMFGSTTDHIVAEASCSVLVVR